MTDSKDKILDVVSDVRNFLSYSSALGVKEVRRTQTVRGNKKTKNKGRALDDLRAEIGDCTRCKLCKARTNIVFGVGNPNAKLMFIGEGPGRDEDAQGIPFVGLAGQLLTKIIEAMGFKRNEVYIANIVKCRPPNNRNPEQDEVATCIPFLQKQVEIIEPSVIVCLGSVAAQNLLGTDVNISRLRGKFVEWQGIPVMPTYHPAFLLRNANMKKPVWEDMKKVMELLKGEIGKLEIGN